jgi:hypothetical protein
LVLADNGVPSLLVTEQLSLLVRNTLDASTEPGSDCEIGTTVNDHGRLHVGLGTPPEPGHMGQIWAN